MTKAFGARPRLCAIAIAFTLAFITSGCGIHQKDIDFEKQMHDEPAGEASPEAKSILNNETNPNPVARENILEAQLDPNTLDPNGYVPKYLLNEALAFFNKYRSQFRNQNYIAMIDFRQHSGRKRLYVMNLSSGEVVPYMVAHGKNSDSNNDGLATQFSNSAGSLMSSLGAYMTAETYSGNHGLSLRLDGLQSTNSNARSRAVVIHPADYVSSGQEKQGRSFGCPALEPRYSRDLIQKLKEGALVYAGY